MKLGQQHYNEGTLYFISSGGQTMYSHGYAIFKKHYTIGADFSTTSRRWTNWNLVDVVLSRWYHFTTSWNHKDGTVFYINGCKTADQAIYSSRTLHGTAYNNVTMGIPNNGDPILYHGDVFIDELMIYNIKMSSAEIASVYNEYNLK